MLGCALAAVGFWLWAGKVTGLNFGNQHWYTTLAGGGMGFMLGPAQTDAVNRASKFAYGEATGITQTIRNYAGSFGLAILGTILVSQLRSRVTTSLRSRRGCPVGPPPRGQRASRSRGAAGAPARSPISSGWTSRTPRAQCST